MKTLAITLMLTVAANANGSIVTLDGISDGADTYTHTETVTWFNGHKTAHSLYGDFDNQSHTTDIQYGIGQLAGDASGQEYFFLFVEAPLYAKNMIWENLDWRNVFPVANTDPSVGLTEADVASYRAHHETHHDVGDMKLDFGGATGSEKLIFLDAGGGNQFEADLAGGADNALGLVGFKDSSDYLLDNGLATTDLSLARDRTMSFEFQFAVNTQMNDQLLGYPHNGLEFHLSRERGLVPEPTSAALLGLGGFILLRRRR